MATQEESVLAALGAVAAFLYLWVAWLQAKRPAHGPARGALRGFVIWWAGLGILGFLTLFFTFGPELSAYGLNVMRTVIYLLLAGIFLMLGGLAYYLLYLYTGSRRTVIPIAAFYVLMTVLLVFLIEGFDPHIADNAVHLEPGEESAVEFHTHEEPPAWASATFSLGIIAVPLAAAIAYALLFFRTDDRTARYRIALVSTGFVLWFAYSILGTLAGLVAGSTTQSFMQQLIGQLLGVLAATLTLLAYHPPRRLQRRFGLRRVDEAPFDVHKMALKPRLAPE